MTKQRALEIYEQHIRRLPRAERLRLLALLANDVADEELDEVPGGEPVDDIMAYHGQRKQSWDGTDAQEYVNKLREEWDHRP